MFAVFDRIGYAEGDGESDWDVLWSHEYPFEIFSKKISNLKPHQKVDMFFLTIFWTSLDLGVIVGCPY